ncbi:hypothetical protein U8C40_38630 (plasmid) [Sinorhizobium medicae]|nr:hypothetical protein U8C40_38630 [Sinorhizobium medicae]
MAVAAAAESGQEVDPALLDMLTALGKRGRPILRAARFLSIAAAAESGQEVDPALLDMLTALGKRGRPILRAARFLSIAQAAGDQSLDRVAL